MKDRITFMASTGGLCNRLRAFGACLTVAEYLGLDKTQLIWLPNDSCNVEFDELFVDRANKWQQDISFTYGPSAKWNWVLDEDIYSGLVVNSIQPAGVLFNKLKEYYEFELGPKEFHNLYCETVRKQFIPLLPIREKIWEFKDKYNLSKRVGVQIRDASDHWLMRFEDGNYETERKERNDNFKKIIKDSDSVFLSADSEGISEDFSNTENVVVFPKKWTVSGEDLPAGHIFSLRQKNNNRFTSMEDAVIDLFLLSECRELVTSRRSSFGKMAANIGGIENVALS